MLFHKDVRVQPGRPGHSLAPQRLRRWSWRSGHPDMWVDIPPGDWAADGRKSDSSQVAGRMFPKGKGGFVFGNALFANRGGGRFEEVSDVVGAETYWPWGPSVDDFNADGWDDIFVAAGMNFPYRYGINSVLLNEGGTASFRANSWWGSSRGRTVPRSRSGSPSIATEQIGTISSVTPVPILSRSAWSVGWIARAT